LAAAISEQCEDPSAIGVDSLEEKSGKPSVFTPYLKYTI